MKKLHHKLLLCIVYIFLFIIVSFALNARARGTNSVEHRVKELERKLSWALDEIVRLRHRAKLDKPQIFGAPGGGPKGAWIVGEFPKEEPWNDK